MKYAIRLRQILAINFNQNEYIYIYIYIYNVRAKIATARASGNHVDAIDILLVFLFKYRGQST